MKIDPVGEPNEIFATFFAAKRRQYESLWEAENLPTDFLERVKTLGGKITFSSVSEKRAKKGKLQFSRANFSSVDHNRYCINLQFYEKAYRDRVNNNLPTLMTWKRFDDTNLFLAQTNFANKEKGVPFSFSYLPSGQLFKDLRETEKNFESREYFF